MHSLLLALLLAARPLTPEEVLATRRVDDVQVSPDGKWASATVRQKNLETNKDDKDIWLLPVAGGAPRQFTRNARSEHARWSP
ncbi:MAG TPA: S9 family peptidase, partial [Myxococcales bacterium]|nr:S9 family peptidase [Myxococcales bacterium]